MPDGPFQTNCTYITVVRSGKTKYINATLFVIIWSYILNLGTMEH